MALINDDFLSFLVNGVTAQLVALLLPVTLIVPMITVAVLAGKQLGAKSGFIIGFMGLFFAGALLSKLSSVLIWQSLFVGIIGLAGASLWGSKKVSWNQVVLLCAVSAIAFEAATNVLFWYAGVAPNNGPYLLNASFLGSALNVTACVVLAAVFAPRPESD